MTYFDGDLAKRKRKTGLGFAAVENTLQISVARHNKIVLLDRATGPHGQAGDPASHRP